ncbi:WD40-repeat-containing domain protein [Absidia repens]|uniref:WD40-repeat-containing domain protein n=1 Tax=Absidia repens TaxID=90262 RepID=A0A1X2IYM3_9FUNG|nr:WD40-repeat-containing domain protein [Absidia repens]
MSQIPNDGSAHTETNTTPPSSSAQPEDRSENTGLIFQPPFNEHHSLLNRLKDNDIDSDGDDEAGITCPICQGIMVDAFITRCGHSFCHSCLARHLDKQKWCPVCRGALQDTTTCPNFNLNKVIEQRQAKSQTRHRNQRNRAKLTTVADYLDALPYNEDVLSILSNARAKRKKVMLHKGHIKSSLLSMFLTMVEDFAAQKATKWRQYQDLVIRDKMSIQQLDGQAQNSMEENNFSIQRYDDCGDDNKSNDDRHDGDDDDDGPRSDSNNNDHGGWDDNSDSDGDSVQGHSNRAYFSKASGNHINRKIKKRKYIDDSQKSEISSTPTELELILATRQRRIGPHFSDLMDFYFMERQKLGTGLASFSSTLYQLTHYSHWTPLDTIHYTDFSMTSTIVSSIEFDRDEDYFAVGGVNREIKLYDYNMLNDSLDERPFTVPLSYDDQENSDSQGSILPRNNNSAISETSTSVPLLVHCPLSIIPCEHKISCLSWNPYIKSRMASSDYEGVVNIWDTNTGQNVRAYREHQQRAWSVDTSASNPLIMASASDDSCVKIWSIQEKNSLLTLTQRGNVCCAKFAPNNQHLVAVGSADHQITCYDLRNTNNPIQTFSGHNKAVSYVKWNGDDEIISASTDNTLKSWKIGRNECTRTYSGHRNEKNFVGLSLKDNWISCGSENNTVYTYHKNSSHPVAQYKFGSVDPITGQELPNEDALFVSSVCWKRDSMKLLGANSKGVIKLLQLVE